MKLNEAKSVLEQIDSCIDRLMINETSLKRIESLAQGDSRSGEQKGKYEKTECKVKRALTKKKAKFYNRVEGKTKEIMSLFKFNKNLCVFSLVFMVNVAVICLRFFNSITDIKKTRACIEIIIVAVDMYNRYTMMHVMLLETMRFDSPISFMSAPIEKFYPINEEYIRSQLPKIDKVQTQLNLIFGKENAALNSYMSVPSCDVIINQGFLNCETALGGATQVQAGMFYLSFLELCSNLVGELRKGATSKEGVANMLRNKKISSVVAYLNRGELGLNDAFYYYLLLPSTTALQDLMKSQYPLIQTANIISGVAFVIVMASTLIILYGYHTRILTQFNTSLYLLPINIIQTSPKLSVILKNCTKKGILDMIDT